MFLHTHNIADHLTNSTVLQIITVYPFFFTMQIHAAVQSEDGM